MARPLRGRCVELRRVEAEQVAEVASLEAQSYPADEVRNRILGAEKVVPSRKRLGRWLSEQDPAIFGSLAAI